MTNNNTYVLKLDIKEQQPNLPIKIVQNDTVFLNIELYDAGQKMNLKEGEQFVVSTINEETQERNSGIAKYDGQQFIVYEMRKADMKSAGNYVARFSSYKDRHRVSSLSFRYTVYEDLEHVGGSEEELTLLQQIFMELEETGRVSQRQGEYAEDRGDYANAAGDYANDSASSNMLNWLNYVKTLEERNSVYPNPNNGDVVFVMEENAVYRYDGIDSMSWEKIQGWDATVIKQLYEVKADKILLEKYKADFERLTIGGRNLIRKYDFTANPTYNLLEKTSETFSETKYPIFKNTIKNNTKNTPIKLNNPNNKILVLPNQYVVGSVWVKSKTEGTTVYTNLFEEATNTSQSGNSVVLKKDVWTNVEGIFGNTDSTEKLIDFYFYVSGSLEDVSYITSPKVEYGNRATDWSPSFEDIASEIEGHNKRITIVENELSNNVVKKSVYELDKKSNEQKFSQITQSAEGLASIVSKKVGTTEVKSLINQSAESIKIKASNIDFDGAVLFKTSSNKIDPNAFVSLKNGEILLRGYYKRIWRDGVSRERIQQILFKDGMMRVTDPQGGDIDKVPEAGRTRSLYYTSDGISTFRDGSGKYYNPDKNGIHHNPEGKVVASGTLEFFSHEYSTARGVTIYAGGAAGIQSVYNAVHIHGAANVYNRSRNGNIVLAPQEDIRKGENRFTYGVSTDLTGTMIYGDLSKKTGTGFRFSKNSKNPIIYGIDGAGSRSAQVTLNIGKIQSDVITSRDGKKSVYFNGTGNGNLAGKDSLQADGIKTTQTNFYIGVGGELRVTDKRGYNNGKTIRYLPIKVSKVNTVSSRKYKSNIEDLTVNSLDLIRENKIQQYNLNTDLDRNINKTKYGFILEDTDEVFREDDAIDLYTMASINWDASQKMLKMIEELSEKVDKLESENKKLKEQLG